MHVLGPGSREASADMTEVGDVIYVCIFISQSVGFHLHVFFSFYLYICTYLTLHLHVCGLIQKTFSPSRLSFTFFFLARDSLAVQSRFLLQEENLSVKN